MTRVLVTGATGLIGRAATAALLADGHEVLALSRSGQGVAGAEGLACDLADAGGTARALDAARASHLLHLAWHGGADRMRAPANFDWLRHSVRLAQGFAARGGARLVGGGSCAEYDWSGGLLGEETPLRPASPYGAAKAACGIALMGMPLSVAWARIFFVYGPKEPPGRLMGDLIRGLSAAERVACTDGRQRRDFLHVDDLGRALALLVASEAEGPVNVASGEAVPVRDLIEEVARQMGGEVDLGGRARPPGDPDLLAADVGRLRALGFAPRLGLREGVAAVLRAGG